MSEESYVECAVGETLDDRRRASDRTHGRRGRQPGVSELVGKEK